MDSIKFLNGKKKTRGELRLPQQYFIAMDDWVDKLGPQAYIAWQKFYTWADRSNAERNSDTIPNSINKIVKKLQMGKASFYDNVLSPLWDHGFIDLQEINIAGNTCVNIIVYEYPQNDPDLATKPLEKVRDYKTEYTSVAKVNGKKGGRPKKSSQSEVVLNENQGGSERKPRVVPNENQGGSERKPNNGLNLSNVSKSLSNDYKYLSNLSSEKVKSWIEKQIQTDRLTDTAKIKALCEIYNDFSEQPGFSDILFISVSTNVLDYKSNRFKAYTKKSLMTALANVTESSLAATTEPVRTEDAHIEPVYEVIKTVWEKYEGAARAIRTQAAIQEIQKHYSLNYEEASAVFMELKLK